MGRRIILWFTISLTACASRAALPVTPAVTPARDLATAAPSAGDPPSRDPRDPRVTDLDIIRITARTRSPGGEVELTAVVSTELFKQAHRAGADGRPRDALAGYRQLIADFPDSQLAPLALFNSAAIYDAQGDMRETILTLLDLVAKYPSARESIEGHLYIAALQADRRQWPEAMATLDAVLARTNLTLADRVEAFARKGYIALELGQSDAADAALLDAIAAWRRAPRIDDPYYVAMAHYYRGELIHRKFLAAAVRSGDDEMVADLDAKRALAVQAYDRWRDSLVFKQAYWATASGYRMSQIFVEVWEAHVKAPYPKRIDVATRPVYVAEVHARVRDDLEKALEGHRMNVELAKAFGVTTEWSKRSEEQAAAVMALLANDRAGAYVTPAP